MNSRNNNILIVAEQRTNSLDLMHRLQGFAEADICLEVLCGECLEAIEENDFKVVFVNTELAEHECIELIENMLSIKPWVSVVMVLEKMSRDSSERLLAAGACDCLGYDDVNDASFGRCLRFCIERSEMRSEIVRQSQHLSNVISMAEKSIEKVKSEKTDVEKQRHLHDQMQSEFIVTITHELRTPLTIFKNLLSNALAGVRGEISNELRKDLITADDNIERLSKIISNFLDITSLNAGKKVLQPSKICIQTVVTEILDMLTFLVKQNNMELNVNMPAMDIFIEADNDSVGRIITKLIENAAKFVPNCGGQVTVNLFDLDGEIELTIEDNGEGIEGDDINKIFDRFVQLQRHVGAGEHGTGLGLAITKELVELHGGRIWVENLSTGGASFHVVLPKRLEKTEGQQEQTEGKVESMKEQINDLARMCDETKSITNERNSEADAEHVIDWNNAMKYCGSEEVIGRIANSIVENGNDDLIKLQEAIKFGRAKDVVLYSHRIKGNALTLGAGKLAQKALLVEHAGQENNISKASLLAGELEHELRFFILAVSKQDWMEKAKRHISL
jgi:signal transduction histidine kinase